MVGWLSLAGLDRGAADRSGLGWDGVGWVGARCDGMGWGEAGWSWGEAPSAPAGFKSTSTAVHYYNTRLHYTTTLNPRYTPLLHYTYVTLLHYTYVTLHYYTIRTLHYYTTPTLHLRYTPLLHYTYVTLLHCLPDFIRTSTAPTGWPNSSSHEASSSRPHALRTCLSMIVCKSQGERRSTYKMRWDG